MKESASAANMKSPGNGSSDLVDWQKTLTADMNAEVQRTRAERLMAQDKAAAVKAELEVEKLTAGSGEQDPIALAIKRAADVLTLESLRRQGQQPVATQPQQAVSMETVINALLKGIEIGGKSNNGRDSSSIESTLRPIEFFLNKGLLQAPGGVPQTDLQARAQLTLERMRMEAAREEKKEAQQQQTLDRVVDLGGKAITAIAEPISKAVSSNIAQRQWLPGDRGSTLPGATAATPADPQQQAQQALAHLEAVRSLKTRVAAAEEDVLAQMRAAGMVPPDGDAIAAAQAYVNIPPEQTMSNAMARAMQAPQAPPDGSATGQVFAPQSRGGLQRGGQQ